jgi:serpin B
MRLKHLVPILFLGSPWAVAANFDCSSPSETTPESFDSIRESYGSFAMDLFMEVKDENSNVFLSPYSVSTALGMTYAGAAGQTAAEMKKTLQLTLENKEAHQAMGTLRQNISCRPDVKYELVTANALWGQDGYAFNPDYLKNLDTFYASPLRVVDFKAAVEQARTDINAWVAQETQNKILDLIPEGKLDASTRLVLTNAIYYKGAWVHPFVELDTEEKPFKLVSGEAVNVPTMTTEAPYDYFEDDNVQAIELPIIATEQGPTVDQAFLIVLPKGDWNEIRTFLSNDGIHRLRRNFAETQIRLYAPKFKFTSSFSLATALQTLGMQTAFDPKRADFSNLYMPNEAPIYLSDVIHKAFVDFNEKGVEAAAATAVIGSETSSIPPEPMILNIDRPFFFAILDKPTDVILFMGQVTDPRK